MSSNVLPRISLVHFIVRVKCSVVKGVGTSLAFQNYSSAFTWANHLWSSPAIVFTPHNFVSNSWDETCFLIAVAYREKIGLFFTLYYSHVAECRISTCVFGSELYTNKKLVWPEQNWARVHDKTVAQRECTIRQWPRDGANAVGALEEGAGSASLYEVMRMLLLVALPTAAKAEGWRAPFSHGPNI